MNSNPDQPFRLTRNSYRKQMVGSLETPYEPTEHVKPSTRTTPTPPDPPAPTKLFNENREELLRELDSIIEDNTAPPPPPVKKGLILDQERFLPIANVSRIMKRMIPASGKIAKEAKECVQECVSEFISFIASEASDKCIAEKRKTISADDLIDAMATTGFDNYVEPLRLMLQNYRSVHKITVPPRLNQHTPRTNYEENNTYSEESAETSNLNNFNYASPPVSQSQAPTIQPQVQPLHSQPLPVHTQAAPVYAQAAPIRSQPSPVNNSQQQQQQQQQSPPSTLPPRPLRARPPLNIAQSQPQPQHPQPPVQVLPAHSQASDLQQTISSQIVSAPQAVITHEDVSAGVALEPQPMQIYVDPTTKQHYIAVESADGAQLFPITIQGGPVAVAIADSQEEPIMDQHQPQQYEMAMVEETNDDEPPLLEAEMPGPMRHENHHSHRSNPYSIQTRK